MLAVAKTPRIEFSFKGTKEVLIDIVDRLKGLYPIEIVDDSEDSVEWKSTELHKKIKDRMHSGSFIRIDLYNAGMTQSALAEKTGIPQPHISQMISGKRPVNLENAKKLAKILHRDIKRYRSEV